MEDLKNIRTSWLKFMYIYTALGAGLIGLGMLVAPLTIKTIFNLPVQDNIMFGIVGSVYLAFGLVSIFGLIFPVRFIPILLLQMTYKILWFIGIIIPLIIKGQLPSYSFSFIIVFATYIIGDVIAIPFNRIFSPTA